MGFSFNYCIMNNKVLFREYVHTFTELRKSGAFLELSMDKVR